MAEGSSDVSLREDQENQTGEVFWPTGQFMTTSVEDVGLGEAVEGQVVKDVVGRRLSSGWS